MSLTIACHALARWVGERGAQRWWCGQALRDREARLRNQVRAPVLEDQACAPHVDLAVLLACSATDNLTASDRRLARSCASSRRSSAMRRCCWLRCGRPNARGVGSGGWLRGRRRPSRRDRSWQSGARDSRPPDQRDACARLIRDACTHLTCLKLFCVVSIGWSLGTRIFLLSATTGLSLRPQPERAFAAGGAGRIRRWSCTASSPRTTPLPAGAARAAGSWGKWSMRWRGCSTRSGSSFTMAVGVSTMPSRSVTGARGQPSSMQ